MRCHYCCLPAALLLVAALVSPTLAANLFGLVDTGELYASSDGGVTWNGLATLPVSDAVSINAIESSSNLYLVTHSGAVYHSTDAGLNWTAVGSAPASDVADVLVRPSGIFLLTETGTLWQSTDGGTTFSVVATLTAPNHVSLAADNSDNLYALTGTGEVARSSDEGVTWSVVGTITAPDAVALRTVGATLYVLTATGDVARSNDAGVNWMTVGTVSQVHMTAFTRNGTGLVIASKEGLIATSADGSSWSWVGSINQLSVTALGNDTPTPTGVGPDGPSQPPRFAIVSLWPNPQGSFDETLNVSFLLPERSDVAVEIIDAGGHRLDSRPAETFEGGVATLSWRAGRFPTGVYFVRLTVRHGGAASRKLVVVR